MNKGLGKVVPGTYFTKDKLTAVLFVNQWKSLVEQLYLNTLLNSPRGST